MELLGDVNPESPSVIELMREVNAGEQRLLEIEGQHVFVATVRRSRPLREDREPSHVLDEALSVMKCQKPDVGCSSLGVEPASWYTFAVVLLNVAADKGVYDQSSGLQGIGVESPATLIPKFVHVRTKEHAIADIE